MATAENLYVHFPFCRRKCSYCALYSLTGVASEGRDAYVFDIASSIAKAELPPRSLRTVYFGGGSPALANLKPVLAALAGLRAPDCEFTVELHPLDVTDGLLEILAEGGVNRISMGVQSLDDATLAAMGRGYTAAGARRAFARVKRFFPNAGVDFIVGYPGDPCTGWDRLAGWGLVHASVYSLQNERGLKDVPTDDWTLDRLREAADAMKGIGLDRYEISNYARPGFESRHNLSVWRGEDYLGLGAGACGRLGLERTRNFGLDPARGFFGQRPRSETVTPSFDEKERRLFRLRTREGLDASGHEEWLPTLDRFVGEKLLSKSGHTYRLTVRGAEVCDAILAELV